MSAAKNKIDRRKFVYSIGMLTVALPLGVSAFDGFSSKGSEFKFLLLGDIHFDRIDHHDMEYVRTVFGEGDEVQVKNYSRITKDNLPVLIQRVKKVGSTLNADFYLQLGDFVEGLCGSEELASRQVLDFISFIKGYQLRRPFFVIKGNHDITGVGASSAYKKVVQSWQSDQQQQSLNSANATFVHKSVRFILFDGYTPSQSLSWLKEVLAVNTEKIIFFCIHQPVVPFSARANWHVFAKPDQRKEREELINLLGEHRVIVLCGHLHKTSILTRTTTKGKFVQVCTGSVIESLDAPIRDHLQGIEHYGTELLGLEPKFSPSTYEERKDNLEIEKPFIDYFEHADFMGYSSISVIDSKVEMAVYQNANEEPWKKFNLSDLLGK